MKCPTNLVSSDALADTCIAPWAHETEKQPTKSVFYKMILSHKMIYSNKLDPYSVTVKFQ